MNTFIGIKKLWYGDVITEDTNLTKANIGNLLENMTPVENVHEDTWGYEESDPEVTEYVNELTGQNYYIDNVKQGQPTVSFTLGEYQYQQKADLQGGEVINDGGKICGWTRPSELETIYKSIVALSKTGVYIIFPKAQITGKGDVQEKNIGLGVQAKACETGVAGLAAEYWLKSTGGDASPVHGFTPVVNPAEGVNPSEFGWFEKDGTNYVYSGDTSVDSNKTYYVRT